MFWIFSQVVWIFRPTLVTKKYDRALGYQIHGNDLLLALQCLFNRENHLKVEVYVKVDDLSGKIG